MKRIKYISVSLIIVTVILYAFFFIRLNSRYPNPSIRSGGLNQEIEMDGYTFELISWEWRNPEDLKNLLPDYSVMSYEDGTEYPASREKMAYAMIKVEKTNLHSPDFDFTNVALESGAWHNQWDAEVFDAINGRGNLRISLKEGESKIITIPLILYEFQFRAAEWESIEKREFDIVLKTYPEKVFIKSPVEK